MTLTLQEAADRLGVHYMTVYRWVRTGRLPATKQGSAWAVNETDLDVLAQPAAEPARTRKVDHAERMTRRLLAGDEAGAMTVAETALAGGMSPERLYLDVLAVAMGRIGDSWDAGEASIAEEHRATAIMQRLLGRLSRSFVRRGRRRGTIVLGAAPGDPHGLPSAFLADPLRGRNFAVTDLGPDTPVEAFVDAATASEDLVAVGITVTLPADEVVGGVVRALRNAGVTGRVVVGGHGVPDAALARALGADGWAADGWGALQLLSTTPD
jgi:excisionase family DNA binding protein